MCLSKAMAFAFEQDVVDALAILLHRVDDGLGLVHGHDLVLVALQDEQRGDDLVNLVDRRAIVVVFGDFLWPAAKKSKEICK